MFGSFDYDPVVDLSPVSQRGFVDLASCLDNGYVPTSVDGSDESYNGLEEPSAVGSLPTDVFEALRASQAVSEASASSSVPDVDKES